MQCSGEGSLPTPTIIPHFVQFIKILPFIHLDERKVLMTIVHVGDMPWQNSRLRQNLQRKLDTIIYFRDDGFQPVSIRLIDLITDIQIIFSTPVLRSITSMYLRCMPLQDEADWLHTLEVGKYKELSATQSDRNPSIIYPFLGTDYQARMMKMHPLYPFRPQLNQSIRIKLVSWKRSFLNRILLPTPSSKTVGEHTSDMFNDYVFNHLHCLDRPKRARTTSDLEALYAETGVTIPGPSEVRYSWMYNVLKPRVYYAQGGEAYFESRYITPILDSLSRIFRSTDPYRRYSFVDFGEVNTPEELFIIYDYASFTTLLADFKIFMLELGVFCKGQRVRVFDTYKGIVEEDLGRLILAYNDICNNDPEFSIHRIEGIASDHPQVIVHHRVAGMLGIYGNIVGCTVLHGLSTISIVGSENHVNTIGDDAGMKIILEDIAKEEALQCIQVIGDVATEKFEIWDQDEKDQEQSISWHYVKRPITIVNSMISQKWMPDFPILARILGIHDGQHTVRPEELITRRRLCIKQTCRLFESMYRNSQFVSEQDCLVVLSLLKKVYTLVHLPHRGSFPCGPRSLKKLSESRIYPDTCLCTPALKIESIRNGWFSTLRQNWDETLFINLPETSGGDQLPLDLYAGMTFKTSGNRILGLLEKIGVVEKEASYDEWLISEDVIDRLQRLISRLDRPIYTYVVNRDYPQWTSYVLSP